MSAIKNEIALTYHNNFSPLEKSIQAFNTSKEKLVKRISSDANFYKFYNRVWVGSWLDRSIDRETEERTDYINQGNLQKFQHSNFSKIIQAVNGLLSMSKAKKYE